MIKNTILIIDAGGRGAALVDAYSKSPLIDEIIAIPGNDLMQINSEKPVKTFPLLKTTSKDEILKIAKENNAVLIDVAQDNAVEVGVSDLLIANGFNVFGPSKDAGQLEWDKGYSREFMKKYNLPVPQYWIFDDTEKAKEFIEGQTEKPFVIKASGLAEGKGVIIAKNLAESLDAIDQMKKFGASGESFLIEEFLDGEEFSSYAISDGETFQYIASAQDHKRVLDGDLGLNTGGMGCSTPPLVIDEKIKSQIMDIFKKTFEGLKKENRPYKGILYLGGIVVSGKVYIIEYNARWGDPEVECILPGIKNDWFEVASKTAEGKLDSLKISHDGKSRIVVAAVSKGYPEDYSAVKGKEITGLTELIANGNIKVYGAGVKKEDDRYLANGGRLFFVVADGKDVLEAQGKAYKALESVKIEDEAHNNLLQYRKDIGYRDVQRLKSA